MNIRSLLEKASHTLAAIAVTFILVYSCICIAVNIASPDSYHVTSLIDGWIDENGNPFALNSFRADKPDLSETQSIIYTLPITQRDTSLIFRSRNIFVDIYVDDILVSQDNRNMNIIFGTSPGSRWHIVPLVSSNPTATIRLEVTPCYTNTAGLIDSIYTGTTHDVYRAITRQRFAGFVLSVFLQLAGSLLMLVYAYVHKKFNIGKDILYLGETAFFSAQWASAESLVWQLFFGYSEVFHLLGYLSLIALPIPFGLLADSRIKNPKMQTFARIFSVAASINMMVATPLHMLGIVEFHYSLRVTHTLIVIMLPLIVMLIMSYTHVEGAKSKKAFVLPAVFILVICVVTAIYKYNSGTYGDYTLYVRIAILCFLSCLIVLQISQIVNLCAKGLKADMVHTMALTDYLTGLYNRTAFAEHQKLYYNKMVKHKRPLGIIQFDVNNLKTMNDTYGHENGDELVKLAATGLNESFSHMGRCYRMGGDEFLVVLTGLNPTNDYNVGIAALQKYCDEINQTAKLPFTIEIAHGFVLNTGNVLEDTLKEADSRMYINKRELKQQKN